MLLERTKVASSHGFMSSMLGTGYIKPEEEPSKEVKKEAKRYLKDHETNTELVYCMFRYNPEYCKNMKKKMYKRVAAICILHGVEYDGCDIWNERLEKAKQEFLEVKEEPNNEPNEQVVTTQDSAPKTENGKTASVEPKQEVILIPPATTTDQPKAEEAAKPEEKESKTEASKVIDAKPEDVKEVVQFDTDSTFIPKPVEPDSGKKTALFDYEKMDVDLTKNTSEDKMDAFTKKCLKKVKEAVSATMPKEIAYQFNVLVSGLIEMSCSKNGQFVGTFVFDPYMIRGNKLFMQAVSEIGPVMIPIDRKDLLNQVFSGRILSAAQADECRNFTFTNEQIYNYVDMSDVKEFKAMNNIDYRKLGYKLDKVLIMISKEIPQMSRYRFKEFSSENKFILISDGKVKNPLAIPEYKHDNSVVSVSGNDVTIGFADGSSKALRIG